jgi:phosphoglycolate phosphatase
VCLVEQPLLSRTELEFIFGRGRFECYSFNHMTQRPDTPGIPRQRRHMRRPRPERAVIFDFDGTIADSFDYVFAFLLGEARKSRTYTSAERQQMRTMSMPRLAVHLGVPAWRLVFTYFRGRRYLRTHMETVHAFDGMVEVIRQLHADGWSLFVASANSSRNVRNMLRQYGVLDYFTAALGGSSFMGKASFIRHMLRRYRLRKSNTWYVGDEKGDVVAAAAAGVPCIAVSWGFADPADLQYLAPAGFAEKPADIPKILEAAWKK